MGFPGFEKFDNILASYSPENSETIKAFSSLGFVHGIQLGLRYKLGDSALEIGWENLSRDRTNVQYKPSSDSFTDRVYNLSLSSFYFGADRQFGAFGFGSAILRSRLGINREIGNNKLGLIKQNEYQLKLHLNWQVQSSKTVAVYIKPFYQFGLGKYDLSDLALDVNSKNPALDVLEQSRMFGLSLVFFNGPQ